MTRTYTVTLTETELRAVLKLLGGDTTTIVHMSAGELAAGLSGEGKLERAKPNKDLSLSDLDRMLEEFP